jgi:hypothetical protein
MADIDETATSRESGNRRRGAGPARERPSSWLQVDEEANRIVIDVAAARRGGRRDESINQPAATDAPSRGLRNRPDANAGRRRQTQRTAPTAAPEPDSLEATAAETRTPNPFAIERPLAASYSYADIPTLPLEPEPQEFGRDLDADVHIPAEDGGRSRKGRRPQRERGKRKPVANPFGLIDKSAQPKGRARSPTWQRILMGVCGIAVATILYIVLASGLIELPGLHKGVQIRNSIAYLSQVITLPHAPKAATWQVLTDDDQGTFGATRERLIAVMEFTPEQAAEIMTGAIPMPQTGDHQAIESEVWFPDAADDLMDDVDDGTLIYDASVFSTSYFKRGIMLRLGDSGYIITKMYNY